MNKFRIFTGLKSVIPDLRTKQCLWSQQSPFNSRLVKLSLKKYNHTSCKRHDQLWLWSHFLETRPCIVNALNTGAIMGLGDLIAQMVLESKGCVGLDFPRLTRFIGVGLFLAGPGMYYWYLALDKYIVKGTKASKTVRKLILDQVLFLPFYILIYLIVMAALRGDKLEEIKNKLERDMHPSLVDSYKLWPLVQAVNFYLLPLKFRVIFINVFALFWNAYIGWKAER